MPLEMKEIDIHLRVGDAGKEATPEAVAERRLARGPANLLRLALLKLRRWIRR